LLTDRSKLY